MAVSADQISLRDLDPSGSRRSVDVLRAECIGTPRDQGLHARAGTQTAQEAGTARLPRIEVRGLHESSNAQGGQCLGQGSLTLFLGPEAALAALVTLARRRVWHVQVPGVAAAALADAASHRGSSGSPTRAQSRAVGT